MLIGTEPLGPSRVAAALAAADTVAGLQDLAREVNAEPAHRRIGSMATTLSLPMGRGVANSCSYDAV